MSDPSMPRCEKCGQPEYACRCRCQSCGCNLTQEEIDAHRSECSGCDPRPIAKIIDLDDKRRRQR